MEDLKEVLVNIAGVPNGVSVDPIQCGPQEQKKSDVEDLLIRYHDDSNHDVPFKDVDIDVSGNNLLTNQQMKHHFPCLLDQPLS